MRKSILLFGFVILILLVSSIGVSAQQSEEQRITTVELDENGDALWTIEIRQVLRTDSEVQSYEEYVNQVQSSSNTTQTDQYRDQFLTVVDQANSEFNREMNLSSFELSAEVENTASGDVGITRIQFTWTNFSAVQNGQIVVGDILSDGYVLSDNERLKIRSPDGYGYSEVPSGATEVSDNTLEWTGSYAFDGLEIEYEETDNQNNNDGGVPVVPIGALTFGIIVTIGYLYYKKDDDDGSTDEAESDDEEGDDSTTWSPDELKTEEEKALDYIIENDGRIKQKELNRFDWSEAKISRVATKLENEGVVEKLRIGRENVLDLNEEKRQD